MSDLTVFKKGDVKPLSLLDFAASVAKDFSRKENKEIVFDPTRKIRHIPSGNVVFDLVTGGGFPRGRITEIFGMEHSCKTAITLAMAGSNPGLVGVFFDHETAWHEPYANKVYNLYTGKNFMVFQPDNLEEGDLIVSKILAGAMEHLDYIIFDSVDAMRPKAAIESIQQDGDRRVGSHAQGIGRIVAKLKVLAKKYDCAVILINQMRSAINTSKYEQNPGTGAGYNTQESYTTTGGHALRFYASLRIKMEFGGQLQDESAVDLVMGGQGTKQRIGNKIKIINIKNKVATPFLKGETQFFFPMGEQTGGFSEGHDIMELLKRRGRLRQASSKLTYDGLDIGTWSANLGKVKSEAKFMTTPEVMDDARRLLASFTSGGVYQSQLLDLASVGDDFSKGDADESNYLPTSEQEEMGAPAGFGSLDLGPSAGGRSGLSEEITL